MSEEREELRAAGQVPGREPRELRESIEYSWAFVTADRILTTGPCELLCVVVVPSGATTDAAIYDGVDANGQLITTLPAAAITFRQFSPRVPVYCREGLFVTFGTSVTGIFVQWRELGRRGP